MPSPTFISSNSNFFENLLEHRFLFDLGRELVLRPDPLLLNILKSEVDAFGFDLVLAVGSQAYYVQMKTRANSGKAKDYDLSNALWSLPDACAIWMLYDPQTLEPVTYNLLDCSKSPISTFTPSHRAGFRNVKIQNATYTGLSITDLATKLFP